MKTYYVYIIASKSGLYVGFTSDIKQRVYQHKNQTNAGFTERYRAFKLVYFETTDEVTTAIAREKQIKGMLRSKKLELIKTMNPQLRDLSDGWFGDNEENTATP